MNKKLDNVLIRIGETFDGDIMADSRYYREIDIGKEAAHMGYTDLEGSYKGVYAIVPLKRPADGMKVRFDGRTFVKYAQFDSGVAVPGYVAKDTQLPYKTFAANDSMILIFT